MTYDELCGLAKQGKIGKLPNFIGYFDWSYRYDELRCSITRISGVEQKT